MNVLKKNDSYYHCSFINKSFKHGQNFKLCYKTRVNAHKTCIIPESPYLCIVFFIVLDLRLTKGWSSAELLFLCPYLNKKIPGLKTSLFKPGIFILCFYYLHRYNRESPLIFLIGRNQILRIWYSSPAIKTSYTHLSHIQADFHEII